jgi:hypothetical protein
MDFSYMVGKTLASIEQGHERITFNFTDGTACVSYHSQDCCESVSVDRVEGHIENVIGWPIVEAEEDYDNDPIPNESRQPESHTWTRQRISTAKGEITFVWLGESNGYYGETPYFQITHGTEV